MDFRSQQMTSELLDSRAMYGVIAIFVVWTVVTYACVVYVECGGV